MDLKQLTICYVSLVKTEKCKKKTEKKCKKNRKENTIRKIRKESHRRDPNSTKLLIS